MINFELQAELGGFTPGAGMTHYSERNCGAVMEKTCLTSFLPALISLFDFVFYHL